MPMIRLRQPPHPLVLIVLLYLALGLVYGRVVPLAEAPDELDHFHYIQHLVRTRHFPVMSPVAGENTTMEANQPPLYYLLGAAVAAPLAGWEPVNLPPNSCYTFDPDALGRSTFYQHSAAEQFPYQGGFLAFHLVRGLSLLLGAGTVILAYLLGRQLVPARPAVASCAAALLAFNPQFIFITNSVNNDVLTALLGAATVALAVAVSRRPTTSGVLALSGLVGLGLLTKFALLALWPLAFLAVSWPVVGPIVQRRRMTGAASAPNWPAIGAHLLLVALLPVAVAGWWYWRAFRLYGDPLAWDVHLAAKGAQVLRNAPLNGVEFIDFLRIHFQSYWAWFGWLKVRAPDPVYLALGVLVGAAVAGLLRIALQWWQSRKESAAWSSRAGTALLFNFLAVAGVYAALLRYIQTINWSGYQGRLAFAVAAPIAALLALGLFALGRVWLTRLASALLLFLAIALLPWRLLPAFPAGAVYRSVPAAAESSCVHFAGGLALEGFVAPERIGPDETLPLTLYGYGLIDSGRPQTLVAQLVDGRGQVLGKAEAPLIWAVNEPLSTTLQLPITATGAPLGAVLQVALREGDGWQGAAAPSGRPLGAPIPLTDLKVAPAVAERVNLPSPVRAVFDDRLALLGYDLHPGDAGLQLDLYWQALAPLDEDFTLFVHLLDRNGELVGQYDSQPREGLYPTSFWDSGEIVVDSTLLPWPTAVDNGPLQLAVGVYRLATLERLSVAAGSGRMGDGRYLLPVQVGESLP